MKTLILILTVVISLFNVGCNDTHSSVARHNLKYNTDMFKVNQRVVFYNGITGEYMLTIEGRLATKVNRVKNEIEVICQVTPNSYKSHKLGLSDNVTYFIEQLNPVKVGVYRYKVLFKPESFIPDVDMVTTLSEEEVKEVKQASVKRGRRRG